MSLTSGCTASSTQNEASTSTRDDCVTVARIRDWRPLDNQNLLLLGTGRAAYHVELQRPALRVSRGAAIAIDSASSRVCSNRGDAIVIGDDIAAERIPILAVRRLGEGELDELYAQFGIDRRAPVDVEAVELEEAAGRDDAE